MWEILPNLKRKEKPLDYWKQEIQEKEKFMGPMQNYIERL